MKVLAFRRPVRRPVATVAPHRCRCVVHHFVTRVERDVAEAGIAQAKANRDPDRAAFLQLQLDKASHCPAYRGQTCPCGCGRKISEHSEPMGAA